MCQNIKIYVMFGIIFSTIFCGISMSEQKNGNEIVLETLPKVTKGFPWIVKVIIQGPIEVASMSIYDDDLPVTIYLKSKSDGKEYVIKSYSRKEAIGSYLGGGPMDLTEMVYPPVKISKGQKCAMVFDVWSLRPNTWTDTCLADIPPGKYSLILEINLSRPLRSQQMEGNNNVSNVFDTNPPKWSIKSNTIEIELIESTEQEEKFIQIIQEIGKRFGGVNYKVGVSWVKVLRSDIGIPENEISKLTQTSKEQISFHKLISDVNIVDEKSRNKSIKDVNSDSLPDFFEPERQLLLLELKGNHAAERQNFMKNHSDLKWAVDKFDSGNAIFLGYKEMLLQMKKNKEQSAVPQKPNLPSMMDNNDSIIQERNSLLHQRKQGIQVDPNSDQLKKER